MRSQPTILFGHAAYRLGDAFRERAPSRAFIKVRDMAGIEAHIGDADVLVVSRLWNNALLARAPHLRFIQAVSAGTDQFDYTALRRHAVRLASNQGGNAVAVAEHALALILALSRQLHTARDMQRAREWRPLVSDPMQRQRELRGGTMLVIGLGAIGRQVAALGRAFGMRITGLRRSGGVVPELDAVLPPQQLLAALGEADVVVLCCPLTDETRNLIDAAALAAMKPHALLINVARGAVVDEAALIAALQAGAIGGAGLDCFVEEPLPAASPLWTMPDVVITSHCAGETGAYETRVIDTLLDNLGRLERGETELKNQVV